MFVFRSNDAPPPQFITFDDEEQHPQGYCSDLRCHCHYDAEYHDNITGLQEPSEVELKKALSFWNIFA